MAVPTYATKLTGILLELGEQPVLELLADIDTFWAKVDEAFVGVFYISPVVDHLFPAGTAERRQKIVGMILDMPMGQFLPLLSDHAKLCETIREAHEILVMQDKSKTKADTTVISHGEACGNIPKDNSEVAIQVRRPLHPYLLCSPPPPLPSHRNLAQM